MNIADFIDETGESLTVPVDGHRFVVGQLAPLLVYLALQLFPVARDLIPVHDGTAWEKSCLIPLAILIPAAGKGGAACTGGSHGIGATCRCRT